MSTNRLRVSRSSVFDDGSDISDGSDEYQPNIEFDIIEVQNHSDAQVHESINDQSREDEDKKQDEQSDEFAFPLFSSGVSNVDDERGRSKEIMKISLREPSVEKVKNERPLLFYIHSPSKEDRAKYAEVAVTGEDIWKQSDLTKSMVDCFSHKVLNLNDYNKTIEMQKLQKKSRPGIRKRIGIIESRKRKQERSKVNKKLAIEKQRLLKKKIHHKRGGKKHKKKPESLASGAPVYRTE